MLEETKKNCKARTISNVMLVKLDDGLSSLKGKFNFVHSFIIFQHIPVRRGENKKLISRVKSWSPLSANVINLIKGRGFFAPHMQMNEYNLNQLFLSIQKANVLNSYVEFTKHAEDLGVIVYFQKTKAA